MHRSGYGAGRQHGYKIKYVLADAGTSPTRAHEAARRLVEQDHVFAVIANEALLFAAAAYLKSRNILVIGSAYDDSEWNTDQNMFSVFGYPNYSTVQTSFGNFLQLVGATDVGLLGYSIEPSSALSAKAAAVSAQLAGLKVGYLKSNLPFGSTNITPEVLAMRAGGVDAFEAETDPSPSLAGVEGLRLQGVQLKAPIMPETSGDLQVAGAATLSQATGVYLLSSYELAEMHTAATEALQQALKFLRRGHYPPHLRRVPRLHRNRRPGPRTEGRRSEAFTGGLHQGDARYHPL
jgi:branched-chain amino acid transport system substrate-binding protein